ncbi:MAG: KH domain-containing protein [Thaumarchaeota archaeon]|nr:KH domain-containing protein [Nitrososphaerota archaeon]MCL5068342.1 KH domain-containing protein [Nitrososphaerota archaeon]
MSSEQIVRIPLDRIGALVGREGVVKNEIERRCGVTLDIDGKSGEARISFKSEALLESNPFKAYDIVSAIARGFSPQRAFSLLEEDTMFTLIDLREYSGKSENAMIRIRSRLIGTEGKARKLIEELTGTEISIYGHTVAIIGKPEDSKVAKEAIDKLAKGGTHKATYEMLQKYKTKQKLDRMQLWESQRPPEES